MAGIKVMEDSPQVGGFAEAPTPRFEVKPEAPRWRLKIGKDGRVVIPAAARALMQLDSEGNVTLTMKDGALEMISPKAAWARIREIMKPYRDPTRSMADELIADRRAEQAREDAEG
jgi:antitoxin PrlF